MSRNRQVLGVVAMVLAAGALAGCSGSAVADTTNSQLAASKSPVQLLRNQMANRIAKNDIYGRITSAEQVTQCTPSHMAQGADPEDYLEYTASVTVPLKVSPTGARNDLLKSLSDSGWTKGLSPVSTAVRMHSASSVAQIDVFADKPSGNSTGSLRVVVSGPCVLTDGIDSPEVKQVQGIQ